MSEEIQAGSANVGYSVEASMPQEVLYKQDSQYNPSQNSLFDQQAYDPSQNSLFDQQAYDPSQISLFNQYDSQSNNGYNVNDFLEDDIKNENFSKHKDFSSLIRELKNEYTTLKKGFDGKIEKWTPEVIERLSDKIRGTVYGIPKDPAGYEDLPEDFTNDLQTRYQTQFKTKEEKAEFLTALKTGAFLNGVPKDKLTTFAETYFAIKRGAFEDVNQKIQEFHDKEEKKTEKAWGEDATKNKALLFQYMDGILKKAHPDGPEAGKRAAEVLTKSGAIKNKDVANLFLSIAQSYIPSPAKIPNSSISNEPRFMRLSPGGSNYMSQRR